jgi:hypothetical protein
MPNPTPTPPQHRALGYIDEQLPYEGMPPGRLRMDSFLVKSGVGRATWRAVQSHGWAQVEPSNDYDYLVLTPQGRAVLRAASDRVRQQAAQELEADPYAMTDEEYALLRRMSLDRQRPGHMPVHELRREEYQLRLRLEAKLFIEAAPGGDMVRISHAGAAALNHRSNPDPDPVPRPDRDNTLPYRLRQAIIDAIDLHVGQLPFHITHEDRDELTARGLVRRLVPTYTWGLTAAAYVAVGRAGDTRRILEIALRQYMKEADAWTSERREVWLAASCPTGLTVRSFSAALDALAALHDDQVRLGQKYSLDHAELARREQDVYERAERTANRAPQRDEDDACPAS